MQCVHRLYVCPLDFVIWLLGLTPLTCPACSCGFVRWLCPFRVCVCVCVCVPLPAFVFSFARQTSSSVTDHATFLLSRSGHADHPTTECLHVGPLAAVGGGRNSNSSGRGRVVVVVVVIGLRARGDGRALCGLCPCSRFEHPHWCQLLRQEARPQQVRGPWYALSPTLRHECPGAKYIK